MTRWIGIILAPASPEGDEMNSRLAACFHPIAGRPLIWHVASSLATMDPPPDRIVVVADREVMPDLFADVPVEVQVVPGGRSDRAPIGAALPWGEATHALVVEATASLGGAGVAPLLAGRPGRWLAAEGGQAIAAWLAAAQVSELFRLARPLAAPHGVLSEQDRLVAPDETFLVRRRDQLAQAGRRVRDRLVLQLMAGGVTFLLPDSVMIDVDVRIGRDTIVYPGVVLEGQTTIGDETVIGPGCRIVSSWVGSGVEMKGWNYVAHTSIRNRAILEPYVRRGFD